MCGSIIFISGEEWDFRYCHVLFSIERCNSRMDGCFWSVTYIFAHCLFL